MCNEDSFVTKQRKNAQQKGPTTGCKNSGCDKLDVDLIKCNMCGNLICEECSAVKITKLRPVMNQCKTLYYTCPTCDAQIRDKSNVNAFEQETLIASLHSTRGELSEANAKLSEVREENQDIKTQLSSQQNNEKVLRELLNEREEELEKVQCKLNKMEQYSPR